MLPFIIAALYILSTILDYIDIDSTIVNYTVYIILFVFLYISSYVFKFCEYHRIPIHYALGINLINVYDMYVGIPVDNYLMFGIYSIFTGIAIFITVYLYVKSHKKSFTKNNI